jgi:hypothetical protein
LTSVTSQGSTNTTTIQGLSKSVATTVRDTTFAHTINFSDVTGTADAATITLANNTGGTHVIPLVEALTINSTGSVVNTPTLTATSTTSLAFTGTAGLTTVLADATIRTIDGSGHTGTGANGLTITTAATTATTITGGTGNDSFNTSTSGGSDSISGGAGNDTVTFTANLDVTDTVAGGDGAGDILILTTGLATGYTKPTVPTITGFETLRVSTALAGDMTVANVQSGITTVRLAGKDGTARAVTLDAGTQTLQLSAALGAGALTINDTGALLTDALTISNVAAATDVFAASGLTINGFESVTISGTGTGAATTQTLGAVTLAADAGGTTTLNLTGSNTMTTGVVTAGVIDASGLTGSAVLTMGAAASGVTSITGTGNADTLIGDASSSINGGAGNDTITGGATNDTLVGGDGADNISGGSGNDSIDAGAGNDTVSITTAGDLASGDTIVGGEGTDRLQIVGLTTDSAAALQTVSGFETLSFVNAAAGAGQTITMSNFLNNSTGFTSVAIGAFNAQTVTIANAGTTLNSVNVLDATGGSLSFSRLVDTTTSESLTVSTTLAAGAETLTTLTANDEETIAVVTTSAADDLTIGTLNASDLRTLTITGAGDLVLTNAAIVGSTLLATVNASASSGAVTVSGANSSTAITATGGSGIFTFTGGGAADTITGGDAADVLVGGSGRDSITGGMGADVIDGGTGKDTIILTETTAAADTVTLGIGATNYEAITSFSAGGGATNDNLLAVRATHLWNSNAGVTTVLLTTGATLAAATTAGDANIMTISTNVAAGTFADFTAGNITEAEMEAAVVTALGSTGALDAAAIVLVLIDDGVSTGVFRFASDDDATVDAATAGEIEIMAILVGVTNATTVLVGDVLFA